MLALRRHLCSVRLPLAARVQPPAGAASHYRHVHGSAARQSQAPAAGQQQEQQSQRAAGGSTFQPPDPTTAHGQRQLGRLKFVAARRAQLESWRERRDQTPELKASYDFRTEIRKLGKAGSWEEILARLDSARATGEPALDIGTYHQSVRALAQCDRFEEGCALLIEMKRKGMQPSATIFNAVIGAASRLGEWARASQELKTMRNWRLKPDLHSYNLTIRAMARAGHWHKAHTLSMEMQTTYSMKPDMAHFHYLIAGYGKGGVWKRAFKLLRDMKRRKYPPTAKTYTAAVHALACNGQVERAVALLEEMEQEGHKPDVLACLTVATACDAAGDVSRARQLLQELEQDGGDPGQLPAFVEQRKIEALDLSMHALVPHAYAIAHRVQDAAAYLDGLFDQGLKPDSHMYQRALDACQRGGASDAPLRDSMERHGVKPVPFEKYS